MQLQDRRDAPVGIIGLGDMGGGMARALVRAGLPVVVHDIRAEAMEPLVALGATAAPSVEAVGQAAAIISIVVLDDDQVRDVVGRLAAVAPPGTIFVVHSTVQPATVRDLAAEVARRGIDLIDAAVSGGGEKGARGTLTVMVGGPDDVVARCRPVLDAVAATVHHVGPVGAGTAVKVVNNLLSLGTYALQLEAMRLAAANGLDEDAVTTVVASSQGDSRGIRTWGRMDRIRRRRADVRPRPDVYHQIGKDLRTAVAVADAAGLDLPLTTAAASLLPVALAQRDEELDARGPDVERPRCGRCDQELAAPFVATGAHPECAP